MPDVESYHICPLELMKRQLRSMAILNAGILQTRQAKG